ncbi:MAG: elongation factor G, partial [Planctomycetes bacterium]|nr:elongation factor G [Planctomycetota bacterium]
MAHQVDDIRTVALVGHEVAGKTSLTDALLFKAKANDRRGSPDDGTSVSDFDEEEKKHKYSIDSSILHFDY